MLKLLHEFRGYVVAVFTHRGLNSWGVATLVVAVLCLDIILLARLGKARSRYLLSQEDGNGEDSEQYAVYYKKKQYINTLRGIIRIAFVLCFVLFYRPNIFAGLAITIGAFVVIFGTVFVSFGVYLYLLSFYSPGNCVKVGEITGEIVAITPLYLKLLGRNESGDHTGESINIPNYKVRQDTIVLIALDFASVQKSILTIVYTHERYRCSFESFVSQLKIFLDETFSLHTAKTVGHYKSYKGYRYKLSYSLNDKGETVVSVGYLMRRSKTTEYNFKIINFLETLQMEK